MTMLWHLISKELSFLYSRSSGPGGQNVNKTETKVTVNFPFSISRTLSDAQKVRLRTYLSANRPSALIDENSAIQLSDSTTRSQDRNKEHVLLKLKTLLEKAFSPERKRAKTKIPRASKERRLSDKKHKSSVKGTRRSKDW